MKCSHILSRTRVVDQSHGSTALPIVVVVVVAAAVAGRSWSGLSNGWSNGDADHLLALSTRLPPSEVKSVLGKSIDDGVEDALGFAVELVCDSVWGICRVPGAIPIGSLVAS